MADTGATLPGSGVNVDRGKTNWSNAANIQTEANLASNFVPQSETSDWLRGSNFGFSVPKGATIEGIKLEISREASATNSISDGSLRLLNANDEPVGDDKKSTSKWPTTKAIATYGGETDTWNASSTPAIVNHANFGARLYVDNSAPSSRVAYVWWYKVTIYYTEVGEDAKKSSFFTMLT